MNFRYRNKCIRIRHKHDRFYVNVGKVGYFQSNTFTEALNRSEQMIDQHIEWYDNLPKRRAERLFGRDPVIPTYPGGVPIGSNH